LAKKIALVFAFMISWLYSYVFFNKISRIFYLAYSYSLKRLFRKVGKGFYIESPANITGAEFMSIGNNFRCFKRIRLEAYSKHLEFSFKPDIHIGNDVSINYDCHIACINKIFIGDNVLIASKVFITDHYHGEINARAMLTPPSLRKLYSPGEVYIEDNVFIGEGVSIMPNVHIGKNSVIGANSVVTRNLPPNSVAVGVPAKVIKVLN